MVILETFKPEIREDNKSKKKNEEKIKFSGDSRSMTQLNINCLSLIYTDF